MTANTTFQVRFIFNCETLSEAEALASELVEPSMPFSAKIVEIDEDGEIVGTVKTITA